MKIEAQWKEYLQIEPGDVLLYHDVKGGWLVVGVVVMRHSGGNFRVRDINRGIEFPAKMDDSGKMLVLTPVLEAEIQTLLSGIAEGLKYGATESHNANFLYAQDGDTIAPEIVAGIEAFRKLETLITSEEGKRITPFP